MLQSFLHKEQNPTNKQHNNCHVKERTHIPRCPPIVKQTRTWVNSSLVIKPSRFLSKSLKAVSAFEALSDLLITSTLTQLSNIFKDRFLKSLFRVWCCLSLEPTHQKCPVFLPCYLCLFSVDFIGSLTDFVFALSKILLLVQQTVTPLMSLMMFTVFSAHCTDLPQS